MSLRRLCGCPSDYLYHIHNTTYKSQRYVPYMTIRKFEYIRKLSGPCLLCWTTGIAPYRNHNVGDHSLRKQPNLQMVASKKDHTLPTSGSSSISVDSTLILMNLYYMGVNRMSHGPLNRPFDKGMPFSHVGTSARGVKSESTGRLRREF